MNAGGYDRPERDSAASGIRDRATRSPRSMLEIASAGTPERQLCIFYGIFRKPPRPTTDSKRPTWAGRADSLSPADAEPVNLRRTIVRCLWIKSCEAEFTRRGAGADSSCPLPKNTLPNGCASMRSLRVAVARFSRVSGSRKCVCASSPSRRIAQGILNAVTTRDCFAA